MLDIFSDIYLVLYTSVLYFEKGFFDCLGRYSVWYNHMVVHSSVRHHLRVKKPHCCIYLKVIGY